MQTSSEKIAIRRAKRKIVETSIFLEKEVCPSPYYMTKLTLVTAILPDSPIAASLHKADAEARNSSYEARKGLLRTNPSLYVSRTRLSVRQIPLYVTDGLWRRLANHAVKEFRREFKEGKRPGLSKDELLVDPDDVLGAGRAPSAPVVKKDGKVIPPRRVRQAKVLRQADRVDSLLGLGRSKGYGFLELNTHADALRVLRWANANKEVGRLFRGWWRDELENQIDKTTKDSSLTAAEKESRLKRIKEKLLELQAEEERSAGKVVEVEGKASRTLIMELSIEYVHYLDISKLSC